MDPVNRRARAIDKIAEHLRFEGVPAKRARNTAEMLLRDNGLISIDPGLIERIAMMTRTTADAAAEQRYYERTLPDLLIRKLELADAVLEQWPKPETAEAGSLMSRGNPGEPDTTCSDVEPYAAIVVCECGKWRQHDKPHGWTKPKPGA